MLSVVILTLDESRNIRDCLDSVRMFADDLLVFDSGSGDGTAESARTGGARVVERQFDTYPKQRNAALDAALYDWVFFIDADERANEKVGEEIRRAIVQSEAGPNGAVLFWIPRRNFIFGKWIKHTGWSPDYQPRLLFKPSARFDPERPVHELVLAKGPEDFLKEPLIHYNYESFKQFRAKQESYSRYEADALYRQGLRPRPRSWMGAPLREFYRRFITLQGYKDGFHGLVLSLLMGFYAFRRTQLLARAWSSP